MRGTSPRQGVALQSLEGLPSHVVTKHPWWPPAEVGHPPKIKPAKSLHHLIFNMDQRESMLQLALADLESGKYTSIRQAAKAYNVPRSTLAHRQHGKPPRSAAHEQQQRLTPCSRGIPYC